MCLRIIEPQQAVPVLQDKGGPAIWETGAILRYLADRYGSPSFWPDDPVERAEVDRWAEWAKINVAMPQHVPTGSTLSRMAEGSRIR
ncbi:glutathione S-transferase family protein [uncultured Ruegeria sp.]|uniref:glutathione S-transferase family protein n=1 Tax=uncultured Ruegeria sp. TaxID=259304 RepID=UPI00262FDD94|nr:glutathione S-transferase family protein [uncultured Ruegeria sp.]